MEIIGMNGTTDRRYDEALKIARRKSANLEQVASLLNAARESGDARATYALGTWYLHGRLFKKNIRKGVALLREAARRKVADALYDLAVCYEEGTGVRRNLKKAAELYVRAALEGERQSIYEVGRCYHYGIGVAQDRSIARAWLDRAEEVGVVEKLTSDRGGR
jgi:TPR repeat protein